MAGQIIEAFSPKAFSTCSQRACPSYDSQNSSKIVSVGWTVAGTTVPASPQSPHHHDITKPPEVCQIVWSDASTSPEWSSITRSSPCSTQPLRCCLADTVQTGSHFTALSEVACSVGCSQGPAALPAAVAAAALWGCPSVAAAALWGCPSVPTALPSGVAAASFVVVPAALPAGVAIASFVGVAFSASNSFVGVAFSASCPACWSGSCQLCRGH